MVPRISCCTTAAGLVSQASHCLCAAFIVELHIQDVRTTRSTLLCRLYLKLPSAAALFPHHNWMSGFIAFPPSEVAICASLYMRACHRYLMMMGMC